MCGNQLHKRNLNEASRRKLIQEEFDADRKSHGGNDKTAHGSNGRFTVIDQNGLLRSEEKTGKWESTRTKIAKEHGLGEGTVQRAIEFGRGLDRADEVVPGIKADVLNGTVKTTKKTVSVLRNMSDAEVRTAVEAIRNQLGRRNLSPEQQSYLRGKQYRAEREPWGGDRGNQHTMANGKKYPLATDTAERLAAEHGVTEKTIRNDAKFSAGVDELRKISPDAANKVLTGDSKVTKAEIMEIPKMEPEETKRSTPYNRTGTDHTAPAYYLQIITIKCNHKTRPQTNPAVHTAPRALPFKTNVPFCPARNYSGQD